MKTCAAGMAYPLCNSLQCRDCGALFLDIRFSDAEMARLLTAAMATPSSTALRERFEPGYAALNTALAERAAYLPEVEAMIAPHAPGGRMCWTKGDTGLNTAVLTAPRSLSVHDISGSTWSRASAVDRQDGRPRRFDLVVCSNVLEHVPAPAGPLDDIAEAMAPETLLYLEVPHEAYVIQNAGVEDLAAGAKYWHEHVNFFTEGRRREPRSPARAGDRPFRDPGDRDLRAHRPAVLHALPESSGRRGLRRADRSRGRSRPASRTARRCRRSGRRRCGRPRLVRTNRNWASASPARAVALRSITGEHLALQPVQRTARQQAAVEVVAEAVDEELPGRCSAARASAQRGSLGVQIGLDSNT